MLNESYRRGEEVNARLVIVGHLIIIVRRREEVGVALEV
jgi:hypothetical protein